MDVAVGETRRTSVGRRNTLPPVRIGALPALFPQAPSKALFWLSHVSAGWRSPDPVPKAVGKISAVFKLPAIHKIALQVFDTCFHFALCSGL